jgi:hypothetical protein
MFGFVGGYQRGFAVCDHREANDLRLSPRLGLTLRRFVTTGSCWRSGFLFPTNPTAAKQPVNATSTARRRAWPTGAVFTSHLHTADYSPIEFICAEYHVLCGGDQGEVDRKVALMVAQRAVGKHSFVRGRHGDLADRPPKGVVIFTSICVVILLAFYAYFAWYLFTSI